MSLNSLAGDSLTLPVGLATSEQGDKQHQIAFGIRINGMTRQATLVSSVVQWDHLHDTDGNDYWLVTIELEQLLEDKCVCKQYKVRWHDMGKPPVHFAS